MKTGTRLEPKIRNSKAENERIESPDSKSDSLRTRLRTKTEALRREWKLRHEQLEQLRQSLALEVKPEDKFRLRYEIADKTASLDELENELGKLESELDKSLDV